MNWNESDIRPALQVIYPLEARTEMQSHQEQAAIQRRYYSETAERYDSMHLNSGDEHYFALCFLESMIRFYNVKTILDVGAGTGRVASHLMSNIPSVKVISVEPVPELREQGYMRGLKSHELLDGDATKLAFGDGEFDLVCEFGMLHHIPNPAAAVGEMLRVARKAVFISDSNNFGQGSPAVRWMKQIANSFGLWPMVDWIKTRGKRYTISEGDGLGYSYSVYNNYEQIRRACKVVHVVNTRDGDVNPYRSASHVALLGVK